MDQSPSLFRDDDISALDSAADRPTESEDPARLN